MARIIDNRTIRRGQVIFGGPMGGRGGIVLAVDANCNKGDSQSLGGVISAGGGQLSVVFSDGHRNPHFPESILRGGIQWSIRDDVLNEAEIKTFEAEAELRRLELEHKRDLEQAEADAALWDTMASVDGLGLERTTRGSKKTPWALGAANIRRELRKRFPGVDFGVRSRSYSMGCSIDVDWNNGPTQAAVDAVVKKYQYGTFDGMTDSAGIGETRFTSVYGGAKHVMSQRNLSKEVEFSIARQLCARQRQEFKDLNQTGLYGEHDREWLRTHVWRVASESDLTGAGSVRVVMAGDHAREPFAVEVIGQAEAE